jgi:hypothetical protein
MTEESTPVRRFRVKVGERALLVGCLVLLTGLALFIAAVGLWARNVEVLAVLGASTLLLASLVAVIFRETLAAFRLRIDVDGDTVRLCLPRRRGHVVLPAVDERISFASVEAVETRAEVFRQLGVAAIQQAWRLVLKDGRSIELGADRQFKGELFSRAATEIAARANVAVRDLGMVDGKAGFLAVAGTSVPAWSAPSLSDDERARRAVAGARVWRIVAAVIMLVMIVRLIAGR